MSERLSYMSQATSKRTIPQMISKPRLINGKSINFAHSVEQNSRAPQQSATLLQIQSKKRKTKGNSRGGVQKKMKTIMEELQKINNVLYRMTEIETKLQSIKSDTDKLKEDLQKSRQEKPRSCDRPYGKNLEALSQSLASISETSSSNDSSDSDENREE